MNVRAMLEQLTDGSVQTLLFTSIQPFRRELLREQIQQTADELGVAIIIRDDTDAWLNLAPDQLSVARFEDYAETYGIPR